MFISISKSILFIYTYIYMFISLCLGIDGHCMCLHTLQKWPDMNGLRTAVLKACQNERIEATCVTETCNSATRSHLCDHYTRHQHSFTYLAGYVPVRQCQIRSQDDFWQQGHEEPVDFKMSVLVEILMCCPVFAIILHAFCTIHNIAIEHCSSRRQNPNKHPEDQQRSLH